VSEDEGGLPSGPLDALALLAGVGPPLRRCCPPFLKVSHFAIGATCVGHQRCILWVSEPKESTADECP
jgi:hypothetical protein